MTKTTTKTTTYVTVTKPFDYVGMEPQTLKVGYRVKVRPSDLNDRGYIMILGQGIKEVVPWTHLRLETETVERTITETTTIKVIR
jgi:hypothetical protein